MNPKTRRAALYGIAALAILASINAMAHSYMGLMEWARDHGQHRWWAWSWPLEIDVFLLAGELALYVAYLDAWPARAKVWPWCVAMVGLVVSVAGNVGHVTTGQWEDQATAAVAPLSAFAGLWVGLLVLKESAKRSGDRAQASVSDAAIPDPTTNPAEPPADRSAEVPEHLLTGARMAAFAHRQATGAPITVEALAEHLAIPPALAGTVLEVLGEPGTPTAGTPADTSSPLTRVNGTPTVGGRG